MVPIYVSLVILAALAIYFAYDRSRNSRIAGLLENENDDLRFRVTELVAEVRRLQGASGLTSRVALQTQDDELMPIRTGGRGAGRTKPTRVPDAPGTVVLVSNDAKEGARLNDALTANGYRVVSAPLADTTRYAHEMSTAAMVLDLRDVQVSAGVATILAGFAGDTLAKEIPVFALVGSPVERERLIDDGMYAGAFVVPADTALIASSLGAAIIRRKTRARRAEAGRILSSATAR